LACNISLHVFMAVLKHLQSVAIDLNLHRGNFLQDISLLLSTDALVYSRDN
jgi:hypothetical protein